MRDSIQRQSLVHHFGKTISFKSSMNNIPKKTRTFIRNFTKNGLQKTNVALLLIMSYTLELENLFEFRGRALKCCAFYLRNRQQYVC